MVFTVLRDFLSAQKACRHHEPLRTSLISTGTDLVHRGDMQADAKTVCAVCSFGWRTKAEQECMYGVYDCAANRLHADTMHRRFPGKSLSRTRGVIAG